MVIVLTSFSQVGSAKPIAFWERGLRRRIIEGYIECIFLKVSSFIKFPCLLTFFIHFVLCGNICINWVSINTYKSQKKVNNYYTKQWLWENQEP
jgi:hypothetical protein